MRLEINQYLEPINGKVTPYFAHDGDEYVIGNCIPVTEKEFQILKLIWRL